MAQEIETARLITTSALPPELENYPWTDITQIYLTPFPADEAFPELADAELRIRHMTDHLGGTACIAAAKFGDKQSGQRTEVETELKAGSFDRLNERLAYGSVKKRRYDLGGKHTIDVFDPSVHGDIIIEEQEYSNLQAAPSSAKDTPRNRELAVPIANTDPRAAHSSSAEVLAAIEQRHRRHGKLVITVSGMTGSGKTTFAESLADQTGATLIKGDDFHIGSRAMEYYGGRPAGRHNGIEPGNHDLPKTYDYFGAGDAASRIVDGREAWIPQYDFATGERLSEHQVVPGSSKGLVIVEGLYAKKAAGVAAGLNLKARTFNILVDRPAYVCMLRRLLRDSSGELGGQLKGRDGVFASAADSLKYIMETAVPTYLAHQPPIQDFDAVA
jgi:uridine kinase